MVLLTSLEKGLSAPSVLYAVTVKKVGGPGFKARHGVVRDIHGNGCYRRSIRTWRCCLIDLVSRKVRSLTGIPRKRSRSIR